MKKAITLFYSIFILFACIEKNKTSERSKVKKTKTLEAISLFGDSLFSPTPSESLQTKFKEHENNYKEDSTSAENIIWYGRFDAYQGNYTKAIDIFSMGINKYPNDARFYRHRGHRYITTRKFDLAIDDHEKAVKLITNKPNEIEPDGMPNTRNIPLSTLHGNIYYHLGLAHYLNWNLEKALDSYKKCLTTGKKPDNIVSATHWIYMILRLLDRDEEAKIYLEPINNEMDVIENIGYHQLCLFYKGEINLHELEEKLNDSPGSDGIIYGIANWHFYNGKKEKAKKKLELLIDQKSWNSFGYIAGESHLKKFF